MFIRSAFLFILLLPSAALAQQTVQNFFANLLTFANLRLIPLLLTIAFIAFIINIVRYFFIESASEEGREKAKSFAVYSVLAFSLIVVFWGIINFFVDTLGLPNCEEAIISDYIIKNTAPCTAPAPTPRPL